MKPEIERYTELLQRRLATLRLLAIDLEESRKAYVNLDLAAMHQHISQQERLCTEIRLLDAELNDLRAKFQGRAAEDRTSGARGELEGQADLQSNRQLQLLLGGLQAIQADVRRLSRVHSELLRRSRRSVNVLLNFLAHYSGSYPVHLARSTDWPVPPTGKTDYVQPFR